MEFRSLAVLRTGPSLIQVAPSIFLDRVTGSPFVLIVSKLLLGVAVLINFIWLARAKYGLGFAYAHANWNRAKEVASDTDKPFAAVILSSAVGSADRLHLGKSATHREPTSYGPSPACLAAAIHVGSASMILRLGRGIGEH